MIVEALLKLTEFNKNYSRAWTGDHLRDLLPTMYVVRGRVMFLQVSVILSVGIPAHPERPEEGLVRKDLPLSLIPNDQ